MKIRKNIQINVSEAFEQMEETKDSVQNNVKAINTTENIFNKIEVTSQKLRKLIDNIAEQTKK